MTENKKRFRIEFTVDAEGWSDKFIKDSAIQELTCMVPYPEDITFSEVENPWHTGTPTEEGLYWVVLQFHDDDGEVFYDYAVSHWSRLFGWDNSFVVAWQKIEPYKEKEDAKSNQDS